MYKISFLVLGFLASLCLCMEGDAPTCVMYGQCGENPLTNMTANCYLTIQPKKLSKMDETKLLDVCPELKPVLEKSGGKTCCNGDQINTMSHQFALPFAFFKRCPTCTRNFRQTFCHIACSPIQSTFMEANQTQIARDTNATIVTKLDVYISSKYVADVYDSCKDVINPSTNDKALAMMCGEWGNYYCTGQRWFSFMGNTSNARAPFEIEYVFSENSTLNGYKVFNETVLSCSEPAMNNNNSYACGCVDCLASCPVPGPAPPPPSPFRIIGIDGMAFIMTLIFLFFASMFLVIFVYLGWRKQPDDFLDSSSEPPSQSIRQKFGTRLEESIESSFAWWATLCAQNPWTVLSVGLMISAILSCGIVFLDVTTDPVRLWASPHSRARMEKEFFDSTFGPFYRTEMLIINPVGVDKVKFNTPNGTETWGPVYNTTFLKKILTLQNHINDKLAANSWNGGKIKLKDICYKPLAKKNVAPSGKDCIIQSVLNYFQNDRTQISMQDEVLKKIQICLRNPLSVEPNCLGTYGGPVFPYTALGGFLNGSDLSSNPNYKDASTLIITFIVENHYNKSDIADAMAWEKVYLDYMKNFSDPMMDIAFTAERGIQDELKRESYGDVLTILLSYVLMFLYITLSLGDFTTFRRIFVDSKLVVGLGGVSIVLISVSASIGFYGYIGVPATLIIIEVIPFLVLAVGVDNMFILVHAYQRDARRPTETRQQHLGRVVGRVAPTILLSGCSEAACFFLGALSDMPAVHAFALYAGMAITINLILQVTCFVALLALDIKRQEANRFEFLCCFKVSPKDEASSEGRLYNFIKCVYSPFILSDLMRPIVIIVFSFWLCASIALIPKIDVGLDQQLSMPEDSFVLKYFDYLNKYLSVGPPVYFVIDGKLNLENLTVQNELCATIECRQDSLTTQIFLASMESNRTRIATPSTSWIDDYFDWSVFKNEALGLPCCRVTSNNTFCPIEIEDYCDDCNISILPDNVRPDPQSFMEYLPFFLEDIPSEDCPKGGHAAYANAVRIRNNEATNSTEVHASYFMTYHTILKTSQDYYDALKQARIVADNITRTINSDGSSSVRVFPYSIFYVFYEQYLTMWTDTVKALAISLATVFQVNYILSGLDLSSAIIVLVSITMIIIKLLGFMYLWSISLNAVSLVNLQLAVGISVEFCSHITHAFIVSLEETRIKRVNDALTTMGSSVLSGITLTKIVGIFVLMFARSQIFKVFYFRMYLGIVLLGATYGLIFLPVMLTYFGPDLPYATRQLRAYRRFSDPPSATFTDETDSVHDVEES